MLPRRDIDHLELNVQYKERDYQAVLRKISVEELSDTEEVVKMPEGREVFYYPLFE